MSMPASLIAFALAAVQTSAVPSPMASICPPDADASIRVLVQPGTAALSGALNGRDEVIGEVYATVASDGTLESASIYRSANNMQLDQALLWASKESQYSAKIVNCKPVKSVLDFKFTFTPYSGDLSKDTARFTDFFKTLLATKQPPSGPTVLLDPDISPPVSLHVFALYYSTLGSFHALHFIGDDVIQGLHRFQYSAEFDKGKPGVMFVVDPAGNIVGFVNGT